MKSLMSVAFICLLYMNIVMAGTNAPTLAATNGKEIAKPVASSDWKDPSPHSVQFITVDKDVRLEVLDWGGSGRPIVLLAGMGNTAHVFDDFAPKLTKDYP